MLFNLHNLENVLQGNLRTGTTRSAFLEHLGAQDLKISANNGGGKGEGELQDVTSLPKKTLDSSLDLSQVFFSTILGPCPWFLDYLQSNTFQDIIRK